MKFERHLSNGIQNNSISGVQSFVVRRYMLRLTMPKCLTFTVPYSQESSSLSAMFFAALTASLVLAASGASANGNGKNTCANHVEYRQGVHLVIFVEFKPFYIV